MRKLRVTLGLTTCGLLVLGAGLLLGWSRVRQRAERDQPRRFLPSHPVHTDHTTLISGNFADGPAVTRVSVVPPRFGQGSDDTIAHSTTRFPGDRCRSALMTAIA